MSSKHYIVGLFWIIAFVTIPSECSGQNAQENPLTQVKKLEASFQATPFTPQQFEAFSARGEQKLKDFFDYVAYISSEEVEELWKAHIAEQVKALFIQDLVNCLGKASVTDFLKNNPYLLKDASHLSIEKSQDFERKEDHFVAILSSNFPLQNDSTSHIRVELHLLKRDKTFGEEVISVWEVLLGNIEII